MRITSPTGQQRKIRIQLGNLSRSENNWQLREKDMSIYTTEELLEAKRPIASTLGKCEKAALKLTPENPQHTLTIPSGV